MFFSLSQEQEKSRNTFELRLIVQLFFFIGAYKPETAYSNFTFIQFSVVLVEEKSSLVK